MSSDRIVAVGLLSERDLMVLGGDLAKIWPVHEAPCFEELLQAIDEAERRVRRHHSPVRATQP